ncbi:MAG: imelysin family protein [Cyanobacteria bacterium J06621_11]
MADQSLLAAEPTEDLANEDLVEEELSEGLADEALVDEAVADGNVSDENLASLQQINQHFAAAVVIPTYQSMVEKTARLVQASDAFEKMPTAEALLAFNEAWREARLAWAKGSAFEFGPVHSLGYGVAIDAPVDTAGIDRVWARLAEADSTEGLGAHSSLRGLGAIAHLLEDVSPAATSSEAVLEAVAPTAGLLDAVLVEATDRDPIKRDLEQGATLSWAQRRYLSQLTRQVHTAASRLLSVWQVGWNGYPAYATVLASAGSSDNTAYRSVQSGTEEIIRGLINSLDVVANETLPHLITTATESSSPLTMDAIGLQLVESQVQGIQLAYQSYQADLPVRLMQLRTRGIYAAKSAGISSIVARVDSEQDQQIQASLSTAMQHLSEAQSQQEDPAAVSLALTDAMDSLTTVQTVLDSDVLPLTQN